MYKCCDCGVLFNCGCKCPKCGGVGDEVIKCDVCGKFFSWDEAISGVCPECAEDLKFVYRFSSRKCYELYKDDDGTNVAINRFLANQFSKEQIESLLLRELKKQEAIPFSDYISFLNEDIEEFIEKAKEVMKSEQEETKQG